MTSFKFNYCKATQAAACVLRQQKGRQMNYYRLLKLLYIADRRSIERIGRPISGGRYVAMDRGPLQSPMLDLINGKDISSPDWMSLFRKDHYDVEMINDPGNGDLSSFEIDLLNGIVAEFEDLDDYEVGEQTHTFAEFVQNRPRKGSSKTISAEDVIRAVGRDSDCEAILRDARERAVFDRVFGG